MDEDINKNIVNTPPESILTQSKKIPWLPIIVLAVVAVIAAGAYFVYLNMDKTKMPITSTTANDTVELPQEQIVQVNAGSPVDHATYLQIQGLMQKPKFSKPEVIENSLRLFDIDNDGDLDVLGFLKITFSHDSNLYHSNYLFSTWYRTPNGFDYYEDSYNDFRLYDGGLPCSMYDLAVGRVTLVCSKLEQKYLTTLRYQKNGVGYYRDVDAHVVTFHNATWPEYISKKGGIEFHYPPDVRLSEKTYQIYDDLITIVTAKRNGQTIFEIKTVPQQHDQGWNTITLAERVVFLKLSDGTYLSRYWMGEKSNSQESGIFYERADAYYKTSTGSLGEFNDEVNINKNRSYVLFTPFTSENDLKEIDNIFASIKYTEIPAIKDAETIVLQNNSISLSHIVMLQVPGYITERQPAEKNPTAITEKDLEITFINSPIYEPSFLNVELLPFGSVGGTNKIRGGGYDIDKNGCYDYEKDNITAPQKIGVNQVCGLGYGDAGFSSQGYYILDPNRKYILTITQDSGYSYDYETPYLDLEAIVESVRFTYQ